MVPPFCYYNPVISFEKVSCSKITKQCESFDQLISLLIPENLIHPTEQKHYLFKKIKKYGPESNGKQFWKAKLTLTGLDNLSWHFSTIGHDFDFSHNYSLFFLIQKINGFFF